MVATFPYRGASEHFAGGSVLGLHLEREADATGSQDDLPVEGEDLRVTRPWL
jgi:hypothetical protein